jgi:hypothetical protein
VSSTFHRKGWLLCMPCLTFKCSFMQFIHVKAFYKRRPCRCDDFLNVVLYNIMLGSQNYSFTLYSMSGPQNQYFFFLDRPKVPSCTLPMALYQHPEPLRSTHVLMMPYSGRFILNTVVLCIILCCNGHDQCLELLSDFVFNRTRTVYYA